MKQLIVGLLAFVSVAAFAQQRVARFDANGDGKVDFSELSAKCEVNTRLFEIADKNGDGVLSEIEMRTAKEYLFTKCDKQV